MKKLLLLSLGLGVFLSFTLNHLAAQDKKPTKVTITITEDDKVTTDTTFELKEGQDPEMIKKMVSHMAGEDNHMKISKNVAKMAMIHADDDVVWNAKKGGDYEFQFGDLGIDLDSIKEAHGGQKVMVMKDEDGNFTVKELGEGEDHMMFHEGDLSSKHSKVMIFSGDEDCEDIVKSMDHHVMLISEDGDEEGETKIIVKTLVSEEDEDGECEEEVEVYVIRKGDKDVKVVNKKVMIEIEEDDGNIDEDKDEVKKDKKKKK